MDSIIVHHLLSCCIVTLQLIQMIAEAEIFDIVVIIAMLNVRSTEHVTQLT